MPSFTRTTYEDVKESLDSARSGDSVVFLLGSVISKQSPCSLPGVEAFKKAVLQSLLETAKASSSIHVQDLLIKFLSKAFWDDLNSRGKTLPFEAFLGALNIANPNAVSRIFQEVFCSPKRRVPNFNHLAIADCSIVLAERGIRVTLLTTNYDLCIESAFMQRGVVLSEVGSHWTRVKELAAADGKGISLFKLHGSAENAPNMVFTFEAVSRCRADKRIKSAFDCLQSAKAIIVAGYSGSDLHLRPIIEKALRGGKHTLFWLHHNEKKFRRDMKRQPFREHFFQAIGDRAHFVECDLEQNHADSNLLAAIAIGHRPSPPNSAFSSLETIPSQSPSGWTEQLPMSDEDIRLFLGLLSQVLELPDAGSILENHSRVAESSAIWMESFAHGGNYDGAIKSGQSLIKVRTGLTPWAQARLAARCATYPVIRGTLSKELLTFNLSAILALRRAKKQSPQVWSALINDRHCEAALESDAATLADMETEMNDAADCVHALMHNAIRIPAFLMRGRSRPSCLIFSLLWKPFGRWSSKILFYWASKQHLLREEATTRREAFEALVYAGAFPATPVENHFESEKKAIQDVLEILEQVESVNAIACVHLTLGRGHTFRMQFEKALESFLNGLKWVVGGYETDIARKCAGNAARLAFFLRSGPDSRCQIEKAAPTAEKLERQELLEAISNYLQLGQLDVLPSALLGEFRDSRDGAIWNRDLQELCRKANPKWWPFLY